MASNDLIHRNSVFAWIGLGTGLLLLIPLAAMQFTPEVNWTASDFIVMGAMLFGFGSLFVLLARKRPPRQRALLAIIISLVFVYVWAELAVGIFFAFGS